MAKDFGVEAFGLSFGMIGFIVALVAVYAIGAQFPGAYNMAKSKVGMG